MKRLISVFMALTMLVSLFATVAYATPIPQPSETSPISIEEDSILTNHVGGRGIVMSVENFVDNYVGDNYSQAVAATASTQLTSDFLTTPTIQYSNIEYNAENRHIAFTAQIYINGTTSDIQMGGTLYSSWKMDYGINSIVGEITSNSSNIEVLQFEIYNDDDNSKLYSPFSTTEGPVLKLYLLVENDLYFFETDIPIAMSSINIENIESTRSGKGWIDGFWFDGIVDPVFGQAQADTAIAAPAASYPITAIKPVLWETWVISNVTYCYYMVPEISYCFTDVDSGDSTWELELGVNDAYCTIAGYRYESAGLQLRNITMSMATGPQTHMLRGFSQFEINGFGGDILNTILGTISFAAGFTEYAPVILAANIISGFYSATYESQRITNSMTNAFALSNTPTTEVTRGFSYNIPVEYYIQNEDDYVRFQMVVTSRPIGSTVSGSRTGNMEIRFEYCSYRNTASRTAVTYDNISREYYCDLT